MNDQVLTAICNQIYARFPEVKGTRPKLQPYGKNQHLLIFNSRVTAADGKTITRTIRVVVGEDGKIGKVTTSR